MSEWERHAWRVYDEYVDEMAEPEPGDEQPQPEYTEEELEAMREYEKWLYKEFKGKTYLEIEDELERRQVADLYREGIELPHDFMDHQTPVPPKVARRLKELEERGVRQPWEHDVGWPEDFEPTCTSANWTHQELKFEKGDGIAYITLNRPEANNALNDALGAGMQDALYELHNSPEIRLVVLKAEGKMFCAGGDPKQFQAAAQATAEQNAKGADDFARNLYKFSTLPQFTMCLCQGSAMGGGFGYVSLCDMAVAVKAAYFTLSEVKLGVIPATISPYVIAKIGVANAKRLFCTADNCIASKAREVGLIDVVVDSPDQFPAIVKEVAGMVNLCAPQAVKKTKKLIMNVANQPITNELLKFVAAEYAKNMKGAEAMEGTDAVQSRKKPPWADKPIVVA